MPPLPPPVLASSPPHLPPLFPPLSLAPLHQRTQSGKVVCPHTGSGKEGRERPRAGFNLILHSVHRVPFTDNQCTHTCNPPASFTQCTVNLSSSAYLLFTSYTLTSHSCPLTLPLTPHPSLFPSPPPSLLPSLHPSLSSPSLLPSHSSLTPPSHSIISLLSSHSSPHSSLSLLPLTPPSHSFPLTPLSPPSYPSLSLLPLTPTSHSSPLTPPFYPSLSLLPLTLPLTPPSHSSPLTPPSYSSFSLLPSLHHPSQLTAGTSVFISVTFW